MGGAAPGTLPGTAPASPPFAGAPAGPPTGASTNPFSGLSGLLVGAPVPGAPATPAGPVVNRLRTGVNGPTAFAASFIGLQAWGGIIWGFIILALGSLLSGFTSTANDFSDSSGSAVHSGAIGIELLGVFMIGAGIGLLCGMIATLMGVQIGRVVVLGSEALFLGVLMLGAVVEKSPAPLVGAIIPAVVIVCLLVPSTGRMFADAAMKQASPNP